jgi:membrane-associated phospholipid phosphatase
MNLTDRIYLWVHIALTLVVIACHERVPHWPMYVAWNIAAVIVIVALARKQHDGIAWEFAHDWLPGIVFFTSVFEEVALLSLALVPHWQSGYIAGFEQVLFGTTPAFWLQTHLPAWSQEFLEFGYFAFYPLYLIVGLALWMSRNRSAFRFGFRRMTDALTVGYAICYTAYLLWPTQSPHHAEGITAPASGDPFYRLVHLIQGNAGVHGNAFPSAHIMLAFVVLVFVWRYSPHVAPVLLAINILMCLGAIYDGYHWTSDIIAGAILGTVVGLIFLRKLVREQLSSRA